MKKSIILAEDNVHLRSLYTDALRREGYDVYAAENGKRALQRISELKSDLIILDIMMPEINGIDVCVSAREIIGQTIPIIMLTALDDREAIEKGIMAGADDYIVKSAGLGTLLNRSRYWMTNDTAANLAERRAAILARLKQGQEQGQEKGQGGVSATGTAG